MTSTLNSKKAIKDCSKYHCFYYDKEQKGVLMKQHTRLNTTKVKETIHKKSNDAEWRLGLTQLFLLLEKAPCIADIKRVELYSKWRNLIPDQYQDDICPKPDESTMTKVKRDKAKK